MKQLLLLALAILSLHAAGQRSDAELNSFLNQDIETIRLKLKIDSLNKELKRQSILSATKDALLNDAETTAKLAVAFTYMLVKLESRQPLTHADSVFVNPYLPNYSSNTHTENAPENGVIYLNAEYEVLALMTTASKGTSGEFGFLHAFPRLKQLADSGKVIIRYRQILPTAEAPEIIIPMPPVQSGTGVSKQQLANAWLNYLFMLAGNCAAANQLMADYKNAEKRKVPDRNIDKLIDLRQKFSYYIINKHCKK